jgi:hypothetical protein
MGWKGPDDVYRLDRFASLSGLAFVVLFGIGSALWGFDQPDRDAGGAEILSFFEDTSNRIVIGGTLSVVSVLFLVWFGTVVREQLALAEGLDRSGLPLLAFAGAVLTAAAGLAAETINMVAATRAGDGELSAESAQTYFDLTIAFGYTSAGLGIAAFAAPIAITAQRTRRRALQWLAWLAVALGLAMLIPGLSLVQVLYAALLVLLGTLSGRMYRVGPDVLIARGD